MKRALIATTALMLLASPAQADRADTAPLWKQVGWWSVRVDQTAGPGCFMAAITEKTRTVVRIGWNGGTNKFTMILGDATWQSLEVGQRLRLVIKIDDKPTWEANALAFRKSDFPAMGFNVPDEMLAELMTGRRLTVRYDGRPVVKFKLEGSYAAGTEMMTCQRAINETGARKASDDPFADTTRDPFAQ